MRPSGTQKELNSFAKAWQGRAFDSMGFVGTLDTNTAEWGLTYLTFSVSIFGVLSHRTCQDGTIVVIAAVADIAQAAGIAEVHI